MSTYNVKIHDISKRADRGKSKAYRVRWAVAGQRRERSFITKALADRFRADLMQAVKAGTPFDELTGLPEKSAAEQSRVTWYAHARAYIEVKWPSLAAKSRRSAAEALVTVSAALVAGTRGAPQADVLREALYSWAFNPNRQDVPQRREIADALTWIGRASRPVSDLAKADVLRQALIACARKLDGKPASARTVQRKRATLYNALRFAVEQDLLDYNPLDKIQWKAPEVGETVDRRVVANAGQVEAILAAIPDVVRDGGRFVGFFGCLYYAGLRPSEAASLRRTDCDLPPTGWGRIVLAETNPYAGASWSETDDGRELRGLKHRGQGETRTIPIPPELVGLICEHLERYGTTPDGRLFRGLRGGPLASSTYDRVWKEARAHALTTEIAASPLARRPYDLRHAAVSLWLNGGVPATEVARRAGHSVAVLLKVYANCIDGEEEAVNDKISQALSASRGRGRIGGKTARSRPVRIAKAQIRWVASRRNGNAL
ncbi:tyrosine-type recombinase/integrase [Micromonospora inositola]|uniref:Site-specific recombinase XerD n=1 Tax=Micromonospora inositola TaxID=47865 RepID=A0A1C5IBA3_9ACTN|nr:tyrosine-type recombinase/integrase [Micromonospora inositola]SCG55524.1 Site-specific recombinase XerD [Micromonospora inositola]